MKKQMMLVFFALTFSVFAEKLYFDGRTDKNPLLYKTGEEMIFTVTLKDQDNNNTPVKGRQLIWKRVGDDGKTETGKAVSDTPLVVKTSIDKPGFVRLTVNVLGADNKPLKGRNEKFDGGAGANANEIPAYPLPKDFNEFWNTEVKKLYDTPYTVKLDEVVSKDPKIKVCKFAITTFKNERNATGFIAVPINAGEKSLPISVSVSGYGFGATAIPYATARRGNIALSITRHGEAPDQDKDYYDRLRKNEMKGFCFRNNNSKYENDFYKMIMRALRVLQYAESLPEWNGKSIITNGGSMGGFQAIAIAALDPKVTQCNAYIPWVADLAGVSKFKRMNGWRPGFTEVLGYFDTANLATRVKCPAAVFIHLGDYVCPPSGQMILFRHLAGPKTLEVRQNGGHGSSYQPNPATYEFKQTIK